MSELKQLFPMRYVDEFVPSSNGRGFNGIKKINISELSAFPLSLFLEMMGQTAEKNIRDSDEFHFNQNAYLYLARADNIWFDEKIHDSDSFIILVDSIRKVGKYYISEVKIMGIENVLAIGTIIHAMIG